MTVICPKCQYENRADTTRVVCARCATLIEVRTTQGSAPVNDWGATDLSQRVTKPMSNASGTSSVSASGSPQRDLYATRIEPEADEVLDIPRVSNGSYSVTEPGAVFEDVLASSQGVPTVSEFEEIHLPEPVSTPPVENQNPYTPVLSVAAAPPVFQPPVFTPPAAPESSYSVPAEFSESVPQNGAAEKVSGWPMLPEDSFGAKREADGPLFGSSHRSRGLLPRVLAAVLVFGLLCVAAWYFLADKLFKREVAVNKPPITQPVKPANPPPTVTANKGATGTATSPSVSPSVTTGTAKGSESNATGAAQPAKTAASDPTANKASGTTDPHKKPAVPPSTPAPAAATSGKPLPVPTGPSGPSVSRNEGSLTVQVGSYKDQNEANQKAGSLKAAGVEARVVKADIPNKGTWYRVQAGRFTSREEAARYGSQLKARGSAKEMIVTGYQAN